MPRHNERWFRIVEEIESGKQMKDIAKEEGVSYQYVTLVGRWLKFKKEKELKELGSNN